MEVQQLSEKFYSFVGIKPLSDRTVKMIIQIVILVLLYFIAIATLLKTNWWNNMDIHLSMFISEHFSSDAMNSIGIAINNEGGPALWYMLGAILLIPKKTRKLGVIVLIAAIVSSVCFEGLVKSAVGRIRPYHFINYDTIVSPPGGYSFPSGHSLAAFSAAGCFLWYNKKIGIPMLFVAAFIAFSRVYVFAHFTTDVFSGAVLGLAISYIVFTAINHNWNNFFEKDPPDSTEETA